MKGRRLLEPVRHPDATLVEAGAGHVLAEVLEQAAIHLVLPEDLDVRDARAPSRQGVFVVKAALL
jgi:hypothetical protein